MTHNPDMWIKSVFLHPYLAEQSYSYMYANHFGARPGSYVLNDVSLHIKAGEKVGICGRRYVYHKSWILSMSDIDSAGAGKAP